MKQVKRGSLALLVIIAVLAACSPSPKSQVSDFVSYMPEELETWEQDDRATVQLEDSTISNQGHAAFTYEGPDDALAFIVIDAYSSIDAAEVAFAARERTLLLAGLTLEADRQGGQATAQVAQEGRVRYALFLEGALMVEVNTLAADEATPVSDDAFDELLSLVRAIFQRMAG